MIGDVLTSSILFEVLKKKFPETSLHYLINSHTYPVVKNNPFIDKFVFFTPEIEASYLKLYRFLKDVNTEQYDAVIDVYGKLSSKLISKFSGATYRIAYSKTGNSLFYTHSIKRITKPQHNASLAIENRLRLLKPLHIGFEDILPKIFLTEESIKNGRQFLLSSGVSFEQPLVMISVLGSNPDKTYPAKYMAILLDFIVTLRPNIQLLFNYIPKQRDEAIKIYNACKQTTQDCIFFEVFGKSLEEFMAITHHCNAMMGNEGGAIHMAKGLNIPTFILFSPHLKKENWFGQQENERHTAVHLSDYITHVAEDRKKAKKEPSSYYEKFKPELIYTRLEQFIKDTL